MPVHVISKTNAEMLEILICHRQYLIDDTSFWKEWLYLENLVLFHVFSGNATIFGGLWFLATSVWVWLLIFHLSLISLAGGAISELLWRHSSLSSCILSYIGTIMWKIDEMLSQSGLTNTADWLFMDSGSDFCKKWIWKRKRPSFLLNCLFIEQCQMLTLRSCDLQRD